jgi:hypothetical protein
MSTALRPPIRATRWGAASEVLCDEEGDFTVWLAETLSWSLTRWFGQPHIGGARVAHRVVPRRYCCGLPTMAATTAPGRHETSTAGPTTATSGN